MPERECERGGRRDRNGLRGNDPFIDTTVGRNRGMDGLLHWPRVRVLATLTLTIALLGVAATRASAFTITTVTSEGMSEPGIAVAPDNSIYIDGPEGFLSN